MSLAVPLTDKEYAECFNAFKMLSTEWTAMRQWLAQEFLPLMAGRESAKVMSIGSGTGDFDLVLIRLLSKEIPRISYNSTRSQSGAQQNLFRAIRCERA